MRFAYTNAASTLIDLGLSNQAISDSQRICRWIVNPLFTWNGENTRVITSKSLGAATIEDRHAGTKAVIQAASHNYVGFYRMTEAAEQMHTLALNKLPAASHECSQALYEAFHSAPASFFFFLAQTFAIQPVPGIRQIFWRFLGCLTPVGSASWMPSLS